MTATDTNGWDDVTAYYSYNLGPQQLANTSSSTSTVAAITAVVIPTTAGTKLQFTFTIVDKAGATCTVQTGGAGFSVTNTAPVCDAITLGKPSIQRSVLRVLCPNTAAARTRSTVPLTPTR